MMRFIRLHQKPPFIDLKVLLSARQITTENSILSLEKQPYGSRDLAQQRGNQETIYEIVSQFKVLAAGSGADSEQLSLQLMERLMTLHALAEHCVGLSNEALRQEIESYYQQVHTSPLGECTEALILKVLACLREFAYRAVPGQRGKGLFANTAQMLAVCDVVCNKGNLGIQLATGEGRPW